MIDCVPDCCIECYSITELVQISIEIVIEITIRITIFLGRYGLVIIIIGGCGYTYYYLKTRFCGQAKAVSGNTIEIGGRTVRIFAVVALRRGQELCWVSGDCEDGGSWSKRNLARKVDGRRVCCRVTEWHGAFGRIEGICRLGGDDLGKWLVREGYAFADPDYSDRYVEDEKYASRYRQGFHDAVPVPGPPKDWAHGEAQAVLTERFRARNLPGDPATMSIEDLSLRVDVELSDGMLVDPLGEFDPIELG